MRHYITYEQKKTNDCKKYIIKKGGSMFDNTIEELTDFEGHSINESGARIGDYLDIYPTYGRKKSIRLNRTKYKLDCTKIHDVQYDHFSIKLPIVLDNDIFFELKLLEKNKTKSTDSGSRYILKSCGKTPFRLNGSYSFMSYLERGDIIDIGNNRIKIKEDKKQEDPNFEVVDQILCNKQLLESDLNILIQGETGTGKSRLAKLIHQESGRTGRFVHINLSAFSESLIESELFGHIRGAFTGASSDKLGAIREADRGTLFLDEIDSLPNSLQTKLLLFLDSKKVRPVGGQFEKKAKVRLIFASGRNLRNLKESGQIRKDFFYRITSGMTINIKPLREDNQLIDSLCNEVEIQHEVTIAPSLIKFYRKLNWPGNIRQLLGHLDKKLILAKSGRLIFDSSDEILLSQNIISNEYFDYRPLEEIKRDYVYKVFKGVDSNIAKAASILEITTNTVRKIVRLSE